MPALLRLDIFPINNKEPGQEAHSTGVPALASTFSVGETAALCGKVKGLDDFELIRFLPQIGH